MKGSGFVRGFLFPAAVAPLLALLLVSAALAHSATFETSLSIHRSPKGTVAPGTTIKFFGHLRSGKDACERNSLVRLVKVGVGVVDKTRTNSAGYYKFERRVRSTNEWRTRFGGKVLKAVHPHNHVCGASRSPKVTVPVG